MGERARSIGGRRATGGYLIKTVGSSRPRRKCDDCQYEQHSREQTGLMMPPRGSPAARTAAAPPTRPRSPRNGIQTSGRSSAAIICRSLRPCDRRNRSELTSPSLRTISADQADSASSSTDCSRLSMAQPPKLPAASPASAPSRTKDPKAGAQGDPARSSMQAKA